ncbi:hypothetical protein BH23BAC4_BH23BAC4_15980 [soil metagenome]
MVGSDFFLVGNHFRPIGNDFWPVLSHFWPVGGHFCAVGSDFSPVADDFLLVGSDFFVVGNDFSLVGSHFFRECQDFWLVAKGKSRNIFVATCNFFDSSPNNGFAVSPAADSGPPSPFLIAFMNIQRILQIILIAIVLMVAFSLLSFLLKLGGVLLAIGLRLLVLLLVVAVVLRFIEMVGRRRRY